MPTRPIEPIDGPPPLHLRAIAIVVTATVMPPLDPPPGDAKALDPQPGTATPLPTPLLAGSPRATTGSACPAPGSAMPHLLYSPDYMPPPGGGPPLSLLIRSCHLWIHQQGTPWPCIRRQGLHRRCCAHAVTRSARPAPGSARGALGVCRHTGRGPRKWGRHCWEGPREHATRRGRGRGPLVEEEGGGYGARRWEGVSEHHCAVCSVEEGEGDGEE